MNDNGDITLDQARGRLFNLVSAAIGALVVGAIIVGILTLNNHASIEKTERQAQRACERAALVGPYLTKHYREQHILPPPVLKTYEASIPKGC